VVKTIQLFNNDEVFKEKKHHSPKRVELNLRPIDLKPAQVKVQDIDVENFPNLVNAML